MRSTDALARLQRLGRPVLSTREAAVAWEMTLPTATRTLGRLATTGLITKLRQGIWQVSRGPVDPSEVLPVLTDPFPSYISGWSALFGHGMIEQIPRVVFSVSLDRPKTIDTAVGHFEIHHIHPDLFGGFEGDSGTRAGVARPEKALFDIVYLSSVGHGHVTLPELELPNDFDEADLQHWVDTVPSARLRTMTRESLSRIVSGAALQTAT